LCYVYDNGESGVEPSGGGSCSKVGGLFKLQNTFCMEKITFLWSDSKNWGGLSPLCPPYISALGTCMLNVLVYK